MEVGEKLPELKWGSAAASRERTRPRNCEWVGRKAAPGECRAAGRRAFKVCFGFVSRMLPRRVAAPHRIQCDRCYGLLSLGAGMRITILRPERSRGEPGAGRTAPVGMACPGVRRSEVAREPKEKAKSIGALAVREVPAGGKPAGEGVTSFRV